MPIYKKKNKNKRVIIACIVWFIVIGAFEIHSKLDFDDTIQEEDTVYEELEDPSLDYEELLNQYADTYGLNDQLPQLKAIVQVESGGYAEDVFQSSESLGLAPNSLSKEESVAQGCAYYKKLLDKANELSLDQDSVFQAYNYGIGFLDYVYENGGHYTKELAVNFAKEQADNKKTDYNNPIAVEENGGWRYAYGNMFYVDLIHEALKNQ